ncbi:hypothetical protein CA265_05735 [Sphingobacteriaceae bacterium GW460-11-11-14-LB5]|nr:hypothetical protein CA265_05735 [Sphingobacteriaceae bacterium GW460-11-11-14-LB5]
MTNRLINASEMLGISMFDHLIVANEGYYSFTDNIVYLKRHPRNYIAFEASHLFKKAMKRKRNNNFLLPLYLN